MRAAAKVMGLVMAVMAGSLWAEEPPLVLPGGQPQEEKAPFTVSKETTFLTGPLRDDGTVDYIRALNEKAGGPVKPEENGWVVWITEVAGKNQLSSKTEMTTLRMAGLNGTEPRPEWRDYMAYLQRELGVGEAASNAMQDALGLQARTLWKAEDCPELVSYIEVCGGQLDAAVRASQKPHWWVPMVAGDGRTVETVMLPSLATVRAVGNLLCARGMQRFQAGDFDGFVSDVAASKRLARATGQEFLIGGLVGVAIDNVANFAIGSAAASGGLSAGQAQRLEELLRDLPPIQSVLEQAGTTERWGVLDLISVLATRKYGAADGMSPEDDGRMLLQVDPAEVDWDAVLKAANASVDEHVKVLAIANVDDRKTAEQAFSQKSSWPDRDKGLLHRRGETREAYTQRVTAAILDFRSPTLARAKELEDRAVMGQRMAAAILRAAEIHAQSGVWPEKLDGLPADVNQRHEEPVYMLSKEGPSIRWEGNGRAMVMGAGSDKVKW